MAAHIQQLWIIRLGGLFWYNDIVSYSTITCFFIPFEIAHNETCTTLLMIHSSCICSHCLAYLFSQFSHIHFIQLSCFTKPEPCGTTSATLATSARSCIYTFLCFLSVVTFLLLHYFQKRITKQSTKLYHPFFCGMWYLYSVARFTANATLRFPVKENWDLYCLPE